MPLNLQKLSKTHKISLESKSAGFFIYIRGEKVQHVVRLLVLFIFSLPWQVTAQSLADFELCTRIDFGPPLPIENTIFCRLDPFKNNEPADADRVMENFITLANEIDDIKKEKNTYRGCTATQQDNSVLIECADGTSGVIAGAGTVVVYPGGQVGEVPPINYDTGPIVVYDANDVVLGQVASTTNAGIPIIEALGTEFPLAAIFNVPVSQSVILTTPYPVPVFYLKANCEGLPFVENEFNLIEVNGAHFVPYKSAGKASLLLASYRQKTGGNFTDAYDPASDCQNLNLVKTVYPTAPYTPAPEILNAAYPVRLEQLP